MKQQYALACDQNLDQGDDRRHCFDGQFINLSLNFAVRFSKLAMRSDQRSLKKKYVIPY